MRPLKAIDIATGYFEIGSLLALGEEWNKWWYAWRKAVHGKDVALRFIQEFVQELPICQPTEQQRNAAEKAASRLIEMTREQKRR